MLIVRGIWQMTLKERLKLGIFFNDLYYEIHIWRGSKLEIPDS